MSPCIQEGELRPFRDEVDERFEKWLAEQETVGAPGMRPRQFTPEQRQWLELIRDHIASSLAIEPDDFEYVPFAQHGSLGKAYQVFGRELQPLLDDLNAALAA